MARRYCAPHYRRMLGLRSDPSFDEVRVVGHRAGDRKARTGQPARCEPAGRRRGAVRSAAAHALRSGHQPGAAPAGRLGTAADGSREHRRDRTAETACSTGSSAAWPSTRPARCPPRRPRPARTCGTWRSSGSLAGSIFTAISQPWLRETAKRWAADDLPRRRGKIAADPVRHYLTSLAALSAQPACCSRRPR